MGWTPWSVMLVSKHARQPSRMLSTFGMQEAEYSPFLV
jgi:hypothetical protein